MLFEFFIAVNHFSTHVVIWGSMKRSTIEEIMDFFFHRLPWLFDVHGLYSCRKIKTSLGNYFIVIGGTKEILLQTLSNILFNGPTGTTMFNIDNTIRINGIPKKSICNEVGNLIFLRIWTWRALNDDCYLTGLNLQLLRLHSKCNLGQLRDFLNKYQIGVPPLVADNKLLLHIARRMAFSVRNLRIQ
jgi:hypothetical protein